MGVHVELQPILDMVAAADRIELGPDSAPQLRETMAQFNQLLGSGPQEVVATDDAAPGPAGDVPVRRYRPPGTEGERLPALVWFHGGGWTIGSVDQSDAEVRRLCRDAGVAVVSVDYRLAPEHPFPAAVDDCFAALRWVHGHAEELGIDGRRLAVGGDSAGGNLAAVVAQLARDEGGPPLRLQLLVYPSTDLAGYHEPHAESSLLRNGSGYFLEHEHMLQFADWYAPPGVDRADPRISPLRAGSLEGLCPAFIQVCEFDPLCDEGEAYAAKLATAGVDTTLRHYDGLIHGVLGMAGLLPCAEEVAADAARAAREALTAR